MHTSGNEFYKGDGHIETGGRVDDCGLACGGDPGRNGALQRIGDASGANENSDRGVYCCIRTIAREIYHAIFRLNQGHLPVLQVAFLCELLE